MTDDPENSGSDQERDDKGRFAPGRSGNPTGKPKGTRNKATRIAEATIDNMAGELAAKAVEMALGGDSTALKLCLDRLLPPRRERPVEVDLPRIEKAADLTTITAGLVAASSTGTITPAEGESLAKLVEACRRTLETTELEQRMARLEEQGETR